MSPCLATLDLPPSLQKKDYLPAKWGTIDTTIRTKESLTRPVRSLRAYSATGNARRETYETPNYTGARSVPLIGSWSRGVRIS